MRVSIHQPHYLAWLPYLGKIVQSDCFVLLDDVEFTRNGYQNRNRIKTAQGPLVLTVPVKQKLAQRILDVEVVDNGWRKKHWSSLQQAYRKAPYFERFECELQAFFAEPWPNLADPVCAMLEWLVGVLGCDVKIFRSSSLGVTTAATQRLIDIVRKLGGSSYLSGSHALQAYLDAELFRSDRLSLELFDFNCPTYPQLHGPFVGNLACLDALLHIGPQKTFELARQGARFSQLGNHSIEGSPEK